MMKNEKGEIICAKCKRPLSKQHIESLVVRGISLSSVECVGCATTRVKPLLKDKLNNNG